MIKPAISSDAGVPVVSFKVVSKWSKGFLPALCLLAMTGCSGLDNQKIASTIQQDIISKGGSNLKSVTCPKGIRPEAGKTFECVGEVDNGYTFTIPVKQQDDQGNVTWDVPHAKGLLNIPKLEASIKEALESEIGTNPSIACGGIYKPVKPGQGFDCPISYKKSKTDPKGKPDPKAAQKPAAKPAQAGKTPAITQTEKVVVSTDTEGNVSWQRILPNLALKPAGAKGSPVGNSKGTGKPGTATGGAPGNAADEEPILLD